MSHVEFEPLRLTDDSAESLRERLATEQNFGGLAVHGVGRNIAEHMPAGISAEALPQIAEELAEQVGCETVAGSISQCYAERMERV